MRIVVLNKSSTEYMGEMLPSSIFLELVVPQELGELIKSLKMKHPEMMV